MSTWTKREKRHAAQLNELGWHIKTKRDLNLARKAFRRGLARVKYPLTKDGTKAFNANRRRNGKKPLTLAKRVNTQLKKAVKRKREFKPNASKYFSFHEFACKGGVEAGCRRILVSRELLLAMDKHRKAFGKPIKVLSGYRCFRHNLRVKGAPLSQHRKGRAFDPEGFAGKADWVRSLKVYKGIGIRQSNKDFRHGDVRKGFSIFNPVTWFYSS